MDTEPRLPIPAASRRPPGIRGAAGPRTFPPSEPTLIQAEDLGGVAVLKHGNLFLLSDARGDLVPNAQGLGLYDGDTRVLSTARLRINGVPPRVLVEDPGGSWRGSIRLTNGARAETAMASTNPGELSAPDDPGPPSAQSLAITRARWIDTEWHEAITIEHFGDWAVDVDVTLDLDADFADLFELRGWTRAERGVALPIAVGPDEVIDFGYEGRDGVRRRTRLSFEPPPDAVRASDEAAVTASWRRTFEPGDVVVLAWTAAIDGGPTRPSSVPDSSSGDPESALSAWRAAATRTDCDQDRLRATVKRSVDDLFLLQNVTPDGEPYSAAGIPWFSTLFGRDALITGIQTVAFMPWIARDALVALASRQATVEDAAHDAEPGKIPHEVRFGEMGATGEIPFGRYYGSADATPLFIVLLDEVHRWTGDDALLERLWPAAVAAAAWLDARTAADPRGLITYARRAPGGLRNQGWKDSPDAIRDRTGRIAEPPIALAEVQGYAFAAHLALARLARVLGDVAFADRQEHEAKALRARFATAFRPVGGVIPIALDGEGRAGDGVGSNPGHCLWSGIVAAEAAQDVATRLTGPDLDSGWGIRSFASGQPGYNPMGYHTGSVWPHDTALVVAGLRAVGGSADPAAATIAGSMLDAAADFPDHRLPEVFCGFPRSPGAPPVPYPTTCSPQAWAAGTPLHLLALLLGFRADAGSGSLVLVRPDLPIGIAELTLHGIRVGVGSCDLRIRREGAAVVVDVLSSDALAVSVLG